jgi:hypothetical protein
MSANHPEITAVETPVMKLPSALPAVHWPAVKWPSFRLPSMTLPAIWLSAPSPRKSLPASGLAVLDRFAHYRMPDLALKTMLPLVLAIGVLLLSMIRVEFLPAQEPSINDMNGTKFAPVVVSELSACQAQSWPNFSPDCIKSPTQVTAARRVDSR